MPPGRKRGANRVKSKNQLSLGDLVLAKVKGFPAWPAKISRPEDWDRTPDPKKYFVQFFGTEEIAFVAPADIQEFTNEAKNKLSARCHSKTVKDFSRAVKEICEAFEELQRKNSGDFREENEKTELADMDSSVAGREDESKDKVYMVGSKGVGNQASGDEMCGLERCSYRQNETEVQDIKPGISFDAEHSSSIISVSKRDSCKDANQLTKKMVSTPKLGGASPLNEGVDGVKGRDSKEIFPEHDKPESFLKSLNAKRRNDLSGNEGDLPCSLVSDEKDGSLRSDLPIQTKQFGGGKKVVTNGQKSTKLVSATKKKGESMSEVHSNALSSLKPVKHCESDGEHDLPDSGEHLKNRKPKKSAPRDIRKESSSDISKPPTDTGSRKKVKSFVKSEEHFKGGDKACADQDPSKDYLDNTDERGKVGPLLYGDHRNQKNQIRDRKHFLVANEDLRPGKRSKNDSVGTAAANKSTSKTEKNDSLYSGPVHNKVDKSFEGKKVSSRLEGEKRSAPRLIGSSAESVLVGVGHVLPLTKRESVGTAAIKKSFSKTGKDDSLYSAAAVDNKVDKNIEGRKMSMRLEGESRSASRLTGSSAEPDLFGDGAVLPQTKRRRQALGASSESATEADKNMKEKGLGVRKIESSSDHGRSLNNPVHSRRRAVRLCDDDDDECMTPVHGKSQNTIKHAISSGAPKNDIDRVVENSNLRQSGPLKDGTSCVKNESISPSPSQSEQKRSKKTVVANVSCSPETLESEKLVADEDIPALELPENSLGLVTGAKPVEYKNNSPESRASSAAPMKKTQGGPAKSSGVVSYSTMQSQKKVASPKNGPTISAEKSKLTPKSNLRTTGGSVAEEYFTESDGLLLERLEAARDDKISSTSMDTNSVTSMKQLIAVAQAKRREAQSQSLSLENHTSASISIVHAIQGSMSPDSAVQSFPFSTSNSTQKDAMGLTAQKSPSVHGHLFKSQQVDQEECEEGRISSGNYAHRRSLSGGTEAAVARDAFEGMIETLSRTKESIGRATRLAIDCAKYGIASEVVELLIRKLESEASFHRRVDLFFLVDSITQCSHSQKGIAGASYIPTVQAALPRLLGAAAPPGAAARENRRQCLKVLRLWLERKILPEALLRRYMDDIGVSNDEMTAGIFLRRPSRAERAIDDPIREMEGMLVDEYGSNATFQLPGLLSSHVLEDEEDLSGNLCDVSGGESDVEAVHAPEEQEACAVTPIDRRHRILEDVDGELEMEDVSGSMKDEKPIDGNDSFKLDSRQQSPHRIWESSSCNLSELLPYPLGSPPLPLDSPPLPPPLPSSPTPPPSPPPPPSSPSPPPPPPPPLPSQPLPPPLPAPGPLPSLAPPNSMLSHPSLPPQPQPLMPPHQLGPPQPSLSSSSTPLAYQPPIHQEYCRPPSGNQLLQLAGNTPHPGHVNAPLVNNEMFLAPASSLVPSGISSTHDPSGFTSSRPSEFGHSEMYLHPPNSQPTKQFQAGNTPFAQRPYHQVPPAQTSTSYLPYNKPTAQHHMHQPFPHSYPLPSFPNGRRQFMVEEQWKMPSSDLNPDNQHTNWLGGGRTPCSGPPFVQEGFFRQPFERPPTNTMGFQLSVQNPHASGASMPAPGHGVGHVLPCTPDISAHNSWRPT